MSYLSRAVGLFDSILVVTVQDVDEELRTRFVARGALFKTLDQIRYPRDIPTGCRLVLVEKSEFLLDDELRLKRAASHQGSLLVFCDTSEVPVLLDAHLHLEVLTKSVMTSADYNFRWQYVMKRAPEGDNFNIFQTATAIQECATNDGVPKMNREIIAKYLSTLRDRRRRANRLNNAGAGPNA